MSVLNYSKSNALFATKEETKIRFNFYAITLFIILAFNINFFYLFPSNFSIGPLLIKEFDWMLIVLFTLITLIFNKFIVNRRLFAIYFLVQLGSVALSVSSSFAALYIYQQPFILGFQAQREYMVFPLLLLDLIVLRENNKISIKTIVNCLYLFCLVELFLCYVQFFLGTSVHILNISNAERYGTLRLVLSDQFITLCFFISLNSLLKRRNFIRHLVFIIIVTAYYLLISKTRMAFLALVVSTIACVIIFAKIKITKKILFSCLLLIVLALLMRTQLVSDILDNIFNGSTDSSAAIRDSARPFYLEMLSKNPFWGCGFVNTTWNQAFTMSRMAEGVFYVDNGIYGFLFYYGVFGMIAIVFLYLYLLIVSFRINMNYKNTLFLGYTLYTLLGFLSLFLLGMNASLNFPIFLFLLFYFQKNTKDKGTFSFI